MDRSVQDSAVLVEVTDEGGDTPLEVKGHLPLIAFIEEMDSQPTGEKGHLPKALHQGVEFVIKGLQYFAIRQEGGFGSRPLGLANRLHRSNRHTPLIALSVELAVSLDLYL